MVFFSRIFRQNREENVYSDYENQLENFNKRKKNDEENKIQ